MSLIPYHPQEGREIMLRHRNAIVVHDPTSQRLEIRGVAECPTCHRPLRSASPERPHYGDDSLRNSSSTGHHGYGRHEGYVDPNYFRMLRAGHHVGQLRAAPSLSSPPSVSGVRSSGTTPRAGRSSPLRRLFQPLVGRAEADTDTDADSVSSVDGNGDAFDPDGGSAAPAAASASSSVPRDMPNDAEFVSSTPYVPNDAANPINKEAFSPNYFQTFFVEERELGRGGKGVVLLVRHEIDGCQLGYFACKRVPVGDDHAWLEKVLVEVELLAKLSHPNLVSYRHVWLENVTLNRFGPSVACAFILQQYCNGGDLHRYIIGDQPKEATKEELKARMRRVSKGQAERPRDLFGSYRHLAFDEIYSLFKDITSGLAYLHATNYIHRDLKPSNCLLHREGRIITCLISDFGEVQAENVARKSTGTTGTISYCAPEVLRQDTVTGLYGNFTTKSDVFSLGMILYFMCFGRLPYRSANAVNEELEDVDELRAEISGWKGFHYERRERPDLPSKLYQLLMRMLSVNPAERPSANEVLLAMRTDSNGLDGVGFGIPRSGSSSSATISPTVGISGRRIQNLDSPLSSTPVPDPSKTTNPLEGETTQRVKDLDEAVIDDSDDLPSPFVQSSARNGLAHSNSHSSSTSLTLTRSHGSHGSHAGRSPDRGGHPMITRSADVGQQRASAQTTPVALSPRRRPQRQLHPDGDDFDERANESDRDPRPHMATPLLGRQSDSAAVPPYLLMPPPQSPFVEARHRTAFFLQRHAATVDFALRTVLFLVKMASLTRPCWPYTTRFGVGASLLLLAALDLGVPRADSTNSTRTFISYPTHTRPQPQWRWDWRVSALLFVLHFVVLALASHAEVLCSAVSGGSQEVWDTWEGDR
ncbi:IKS protein kinase [Sporothrix schenckii ATCC 58251]|uniref:non-specific serine/threonine protein kinase n=1 Tax=Sporothrix schenckii (strain ATCC 58251 / de Perez 2211183) TaxID=1391915 RepID=U7PLW6_SPOS1|nr:IKS protein kinase [Sporothrix schenckii ATCC 58251]